ncbi:MAG: DNA (cytosine-5-)-methyltransferase [Sulfuriferula sp.]
MGVDIIRFADVFCGIGGFRYGLESAAETLGVDTQCVFSSDIDEQCQASYSINFLERPVGDITQISASSLPDFDLLLAGFPCQAFSIIGRMQGFDDTRGTLFFDLARILAEKKPAFFVLENVKQLVGHNQGETLKVIMQVLRDLGYDAQYKVLNALDFGLPQKRERVWIVGSLHGLHGFEFPAGDMVMQPLEDILERDIPSDFFASEKIKAKRLEKINVVPNHATIWHENKSGHVSALPYSCALRAGASYNYLLVNGERRLTPREMLRLQGFPESFKVVVNTGQIRKQVGNSLPVTVAKHVIQALLHSQKEYVGANTKIKNGGEIQATLSFE